MKILLNSKAGHIFYAHCMGLWLLILTTCSSLILMPTAVVHAGGTASFFGAERNVYRTGNDPKAKGLDVSFEYPGTWTGRPGKRPNVLYQVTNRKEGGTAICNLTILNFPAVIRMAPDEIDEFFNPELLSEFIPKGATYIDGAITTIDANKAAMTRFKSRTSLAGMDVLMYTTMFTTYYDGRLIYFGCMLGGIPNESDDNLRKRFEAHQHLFKLIASTLIIHDRWKTR